MRTHWYAAIVLSFGAVVASAKLPPPTPEQQQAAAALAEKEKAQLEKEKQDLDRAQDRVADRYKRSKGLPTAGTQRAERTEATNMPKAAKELPRQTGPQGGTKQSAEAHSAPAK